MHEHHVSSNLLTQKVDILVVGAGGNGSEMLAKLAKIHYAMRELGHPGFHVTAMDGDTVSASNVGRQMFYPCDVGAQKTDVLIQRINMGLGTDWHSVPHMLTGNESIVNTTDIVIGCVDNRKARALIHKSFANGYYMDLGNSAHTGQVVIGEFGGWKHGRNDAPRRLPHAIDLYPELADADQPDDDEPSCSMAEALAKQDLCINTVLTSWGMRLLWQMFRHGRLAYHGNFVNLVSGRVAPIPVDEAVWARMGYTGTRAKEKEVA